jgi:hypothetical protein
VAYNTINYRFNPLPTIKTIKGEIIKETAMDLSRIDEWKLYRGNNDDIKVDTKFELSNTLAKLENLEELMLVVKYIIE